MAFKKGNYQPDLSFGTHFFQDLVEASIVHLPLYPDDPAVRFNGDWLGRCRNILPDLLPEAEPLARAIRVIDVAENSEGKVVRMWMDGEEGKALALLAARDSEEGKSTRTDKWGSNPPSTEDHWVWRLRIAEQLAHSMDPAVYGVKGLYLFGSTKNGTAGPCSDIDLLVHVEAAAEQRERLSAWLDGWSLALAEANFLRTGYRTSGLLDVHFITDDDLAARTSYAVKIGAVSNAARPLALKKSGTAG